MLLGHVEKTDGSRGALEISDGDKCFEQWFGHDLDKWQTMPTEYSFKKVHGAGDVIPQRFESAEACCLLRLPTSNQG